jgi:hypothetical protein
MSTREFQQLVRPTFLLRLAVENGKIKLHSLIDRQLFLTYSKSTRIRGIDQDWLFNPNMLR